MTYVRTYARTVICWTEPCVSWVLIILVFSVNPFHTTDLFLYSLWNGLNGIYSTRIWIGTGKAWIYKKYLVTYDQGNPGKTREVTQCWVKPWKSQRILSICIGSKGVIAWCHALEIIALDQSHAVLWWIQNATWNGLCKPKETLKDLHYTKILVVSIDGPKVSLTIELNIKWPKI